MIAVIVFFTALVLLAVFFACAVTYTAFKYDLNKPLTKDDVK